MHDAVHLFLLGLVYGTTVCSLTCLPYLGPYLLATGKGFRDGIRSSLTFISGKIFTYLVLGASAAYLGHILMPENYPEVRFIQGTTLIIAGLVLPLIREGCNKKSRLMIKGASLFALGISTSIVPCLPLLGLFILAAKSGSLIKGSIYGLMYGLGLILSPTLIAGGILSLVSKVVKVEAKGFIPYLQGISVLLMVIMGIKIIMA